MTINLNFNPKGIRDKIISTVAKGLGNAANTVDMLQSSKDDERKAKFRNKWNGAIKKLTIDDK